MAMKERSFQNEEYRFGFNGMENDTDFGSEITDHGARLYNKAIVRWFACDPLESKYPSFSGYVGIGNSPINFTDIDGKILRDKNGNIIVTFAKDSKEKKYETKYQIKNPDGTFTVTLIEIKFQTGTIYTNNGRGLKADITLSGTTTKYVTDKDGNVLSKSTKNEVERSQRDIVSDCHGLTFTNDKMWIDNYAVDDGSKTIDLLLEDEYTPVSASEGEIVIFRAAKAGDGGAKKKGDIIHSSRRNTDGSYTSNAGEDCTKNCLSLEGAAGEAFGGSTMTDISKSGTVQHYKHKGDKFINLSKGTPLGITENVKQYSEEDVKKILGQ